MSLVWRYAVNGASDVVGSRMRTSNDHLHDLAASLGTRREPGFALIVAFDFYDGPERGLALLPFGEGIRFSTLGDSRSRLFRSFELTPIEGLWCAQARSVPEVSAATDYRPIVLPSESSEALAQLERDVFIAPATGYYVGVGGTYLQWLAVSPLPEKQRDALRQLDGSPAGFHAVHQILKRRAQVMREAS